MLRHLSNFGALMMSATAQPKLNLDGAIELPVRLHLTYDFTADSIDL